MHQDRVHTGIASRAARAFSSLVCLGILAAAGTAPHQATGTAPALAEALQRGLEHTVSRFPGRIGVHVRHLDTGVEAGIDADSPYPMASTYKVPILVEMMARVESGDWTLDMPIELTPADQHIGSGLLQDLWAPGLTLSLRNVATMMIILSDNSATDMLLDRVGAGNVTARMRAVGLDTIRVDRTTLELILDYVGVPYAGLEEASLQEIQAAIRRADRDDDDTAAAAEAFYRMPKDVASARDMNDLLTSIARGEALEPESCEVIVEILRRTQTGENRLRGLLPPGTEVAHKTGTIGRVVNDVGIVTLPEGRGRFAISVFTLADPGVESARNERAIADLARTSFELFAWHGEAASR